MKQFLAGLLAVVFLYPTTAFSQFYGYNGPTITYGTHNNSKLRTSVGTHGGIGRLTYEGSGVYNGNIYGSYTSLWIGGVVNGDSLVSTTSVPGGYGNLEFLPSYPPSGDIDDISPDIESYPNTMFRPELIYRAEYTDTFANHNFYYGNDSQYHKPLRIRVIQTSYSYNYTYADDFIIVEYKILSMNKKPIKDMFIGLYHEGSVFYPSTFSPGGDVGDLEGFLDKAKHEFPELDYEELNAAWVADASGRPSNREFNRTSLRHTMAIVPLKVPASATLHNFNWWVVTKTTLEPQWEITDSWGPRQRGSFINPLRLFNGQLGVTYSDQDRYYLMAFPERDYAGYYANTDFRIHNWQGSHPTQGADIANGHSVEFVTSVGPFDLQPGEYETIAFAFVMGKNFHTKPTAYADYLYVGDVSSFTKTLNQWPLIDNIRNAKRLFDNPGVDTDGDGDSGKYVLRYDDILGNYQNVYYEGDGVPDYAIAKPPPPPKLRVTSEDNKIILRWNGRGVENFFDKFSSIRDFEGYRIYIARSQLKSELTILATYDKENYNRYKWNSALKEYKLTEIPFSIDSLYALYGDDFDPLAYDAFHPLVTEDWGKYYFTNVDANFSDLMDINKIHKLYPDAVLDTSDVDDEGRMRFYEYEYIIDNLLATIPYFVSITAFDFGNPIKELDPMESDPMSNQIETYAIGLSDWDSDIDESDLKAYVFPNPYISDGRYRSYSFENRFTDHIRDKSRAIYFANIPNRCTISIFSLDGDLIKEIGHNEPPESGTAHIAKWDVINRNIQTVESGLFYWVIESDQGNQIGKLVIIR